MTMDGNPTFWSDAVEALHKFKVLDLTQVGVYQRIEAEADTGNKYVMYAVPADLRYGSDDVVLTVWQPWKAVWDVTPGRYLTPEYFVKRWGSADRGKKLEFHHGGDVFALLKCAEVLIDLQFPYPGEVE